MSNLVSFVRYVNLITKNYRTLREVGKFLYSNITRLNVFLPPPRVLVNGNPKSGTHLLLDCLSLFPKMYFSGRQFSLAEFVLHPYKPQELQFYARNPSIPIQYQRLKSFLAACPNGMFVTSHSRYHKDLRDILVDLSFRHIFLLRDPRDIVVSYTFFVTKEHWTHHHYYYTEVLKTKEERLMKTILGFPGDEKKKIRPLASIGEIMEGHIPWLLENDILICKFEDLVGEAGGGNDDKQHQTIRKISHYINRPIDDDQLRTIAKKMYSTKSLTFRKGLIGDWRNHFTPEHKEAFKKVANEILIKLGYESDYSW